MKIHRIKISNFRNFDELDVHVGNQLVIVGENKVGKSNLLFALRLILDPSLPDNARQLNETDFWDGLDSPIANLESIEISIDFAEFENNEDLLAVLAEHLVHPDPMIARLTYTFRPRSDLGGIPKSTSDYEFFIYGGDRIDNRIGYSVRRRIPMEFLHALRDTERDLATWSQSPLKPLLDEATGQIDRTELAKIAEAVFNSTEAVLDITATNPDAAAEAIAENAEQEEIQQEETRPIRDLSDQIATKLLEMAGANQSLGTILGFSPSDPERFLRAIRFLIDNGKRGLGDASLGSANLLYLALKSLEIDQLAISGNRDYTFLAIEEPEAHLHPHLQRLVYRDFLRKRVHQDSHNREDEGRDFQSIILTTHSPHIISVTPLRSIVLLRKTGIGSPSIGVSAAQSELDEIEENDIERYLDVNRGELLFAKTVILVEGASEEYLLPIFANLLGYDFDELGVSVCSVDGTNFAPYVKLFSQKNLNIPFAILTDLDPRENKDPLGHSRVIRLLEIICPDEIAGLSQNDKIDLAPSRGLFLNADTLELELARTKGAKLVFDTLATVAERDSILKRAYEWRDDPDAFDESQFMKDISAVGKGRFAQSLARNLTEDCCPAYVENAIRFVAGE